MIELYQEKKLPMKTICEMMNISKSTLNTYVKEANLQSGNP
ncbi:hypothetical protein [Nitrosomonas aestuarii]